MLRPAGLAVASVEETLAWRPGSAKTRESQTSCIVPVVHALRFETPGLYHYFRGRLDFVQFRSGRLTIAAQAVESSFRSSRAESGSDSVLCLRRAR